MNEDTVFAALGVTAIVATVQESLPVALRPEIYRALRATLATSAVLLTNRRPWHRAVLAGLGIWGAAELLQLGYSVLMMSADTMLINISRQSRNRRVI
jgi:hypothetical protein